MDNWVKLNVQGLANSQIQSGAFALILTEENGMRRMPIIVGTAEAQSIAIVLEQLTPPRPLTHDLFVSFMKTYRIRLLKVHIYKFYDGIYFSKLLFIDEKGEEKEIDSRTSDAIAIALRVGADIYTTEEILSQSGVILEEEGEVEKEQTKSSVSEDKKNVKKTPPLLDKVSSMEYEELLHLLEETIANEKYEEALIIQEELNRRAKDTKAP